MKNTKKEGNSAIKVAIYILLTLWIGLLMALIGVYVLRLQGYDNFAEWKNRNREQEVLSTDVVTATPTPMMTPTPVSTPTAKPIPEQNITPVPTGASEVSPDAGTPTEQPTPTVAATPTLELTATNPPTPTPTSVLLQPGEMVTGEGMPEYFTGIADIDNNIREQVAQFSDAWGLLNYESYRVGNYYSVVFRKTEILNEKEKEVLLPLVYNLVTKEQMQGSDLIKENYFPIIKERLQTELVEMFPEFAGDVFTTYEEIYRKEDYQQIYLTNDYLVFYFGGETLTEQAHAPFTYGVELSEAMAFLRYDMEGFERTPYIRELDPNSKMVALTFDDGPLPSLEKRLTDLLAKYDSRATFFFLGMRAGEWFPGSAKAVYDAGHEVASHTYSHEVDFSANAKSQKAVMWKEFNATNLVLAMETGYAPDYIRFPGGSAGVWSKQFPQIIVNWDVDSVDYAEKRKADGAEIIFNRLENKTIRDGSVVLLHSIYENTYQAVENFIPYLKEQGFELVTLSELIYYKGIVPEYGVVYNHFVVE